MPTFEVVRADFKKTFPLKDGSGELAVYELELKDKEGFIKAEIVQKPTTAAPQPGPIEGTLEPGQFGMKFKKAKPAFNGRGGGRSPEETAQIVRQHSQKVAINWCLILNMKGRLPDDVSVEWLKPVIDWFQQDAMSGGKS